MPLPPIVRKSDTFPLISPLDSCLLVDQLEEGWAKAYQDGLDITTLPVEGEPTIFHVRALTARELDLARSLSFGADEKDAEEQLLSTACYFDYIVRMGLERVENWAGFDYAKTRIYGVRLWPERLLDDMDPHTCSFLALAIHKKSIVPLERGGRSGSSPDATPGTTADTPKKASP